MNNRIFEHAKQVELIQWDKLPSGAITPDYESVVKAKRFAELIVRECAELFVDQKHMILNPHEPFANERIRALKDHDMDTVRKIKGHFGVK